jgi:hypothetical protein
MILGVLLIRVASLGRLSVVHALSRKPPDLGHVGFERFELAFRF